MSDYREHLVRCEWNLPDIAGTAAEIARFRCVPFSIRYDYLSARAEALAATGTVAFENAYSAAIAQKFRVWDEVRNAVPV